MSEVAKAGRTLIDALTRRFIEPGAIKAVAKAKAEAHRTEELGKLDVDIAKREKMERAVDRLIDKATFELENLETVANQAVPLLKDKENPKVPDVDWTTAFSRHAADVSNKEMQALWAKILAGEVNQPGSFSKRTMSLMADISKEDAVMFETLCRFRTSHGVLVYNLKDEIYSKNGLSFGLLRNLFSTGLIDIALGGIEYTRSGLPNLFGVFYNGRAIFLPNTPLLLVGQVALTRSGEEMASVCQVMPIEGFPEYLLKRWYEKGAYEYLSRTQGNPQMIRKLNPNSDYEISELPTSPSSGSG